jgi:ribokinase
VVGSINYDLTTYVERLPRPGETLTGAESIGGPGGKGANQAVAAARLGARVRMVGKLGDDLFTDELRSSLAAHGVEVDGLRYDDGNCGRAVILVDAAGENAIVVDPGANWRLEPDDVALGEGDAVLCQLEIAPEVVEDVAAKAPGFFCLNAAPARPVSAAVLRRADLVVVNSYELDALDETPRLVALTLGPEGAVLLEGGEEVARARPPAVRAVDGTAAGDAFTACLVVSLLEGRDRDDALRRACAAGALTAARRGAQAALPSAAELEAILAR